MTKTEKLLCELIALPSVNPGFLPAGDVRAGERNVTEFLTATAAQAGLDVELQPVFPHRANLLVRLAPTGKIRQRILLAPHLDTVGVAADAQFTPVRKNGRIYGRGACDTKGSVAAMFTALVEVAGLSKRPAHTEIFFAGLVDEECAQGGSRALTRGGFAADLAIIGEPTRLKIVTAHKGVLWLQLETRGKAAHGARPELGRNAVHAMARIVDALETDYAADLRRRPRHRLLGRPSINVGSIHGGRQPNIVPAQCVIAMDRRTLPGESDLGVTREIKSFLHRRKLSARIQRVADIPCVPLETSSQLPLVRQFLDCAGQTTPVGVDYFSDAAVLAAGGIPSVVFGPGDIAQAHTPDEWVALSQLERGKNLLARFLRSLP